MELESPEDYRIEESLEETSDGDEKTAEDMVDGTADFSGLGDSTPRRVTGNGDHFEHQRLDGDLHLLKKSVNDDAILPVDHETQIVTARSASNAENCDAFVDEFVTNRQAFERRLPSAVLPLLRYYQYESSDSSSR